MREPKLATAIGMGVLILISRPAEKRAGAQESACERVTVEVSPGLEPLWLRAVDDMRVTLAHELTGTECVPVRLEVEPSPEGVVVRAQSTDGRQTMRLVRDPRVLVPIALGLLARAPVEPSATPPGSGQPAPAVPLSSEDKDLPDFPPPRVAKSTTSTRVGVELGLSSGVRAGVPTDVAMWDNELRVDVLLNAWSILALMRYAPLAAVSGLAPDTDAYEEIGVGFGAGRELRWGRQTLDLTVSPSIVFVTMETDKPTENEGELAQLRINLAARYGYPLGGGWKCTLTLDSEAAPSSLIRARYPSPALPPVPAWTVGFRLGAAASLL